jgi:hypothetical protein
MRSTVGALLATLICAPTLGAQIVRGKLLQAGSDQPLADAVVSAIDSARVMVDETRSLENGQFFLDVRGVRRLRFVVRKLGVQPTESDAFELPADRDTIDLEIAAPMFGVTLATVKVVAAPRSMPTYNENQLREARRNGWRVIDPRRVAEERGTVQSLGEMMRRLPLAGVRPPEGGQGCYYYIRTGRCLSLVVDGQVLGPNAFISSNDVYFYALVTPSQATIAYGPRARDGAIFVATRRQEDERQPRP